MNHRDFFEEFGKFVKSLNGSELVVIRDYFNDGKMQAFLKIKEHINSTIIAEHFEKVSDLLIEMNQINREILGTLKSIDGELERLSFRVGGE